LEGVDILAIRVKDPVSGFTHLAGLFLSVAGLVLLVYYAALYSTVRHIVSFSIYGASLILLYTSSSVYHLLPLAPPKIKLLRRIDHMMIFVLIAGTYTPISLIALRGAWGWSLFGTAWGIALAGIVIKIFWLEAPRWLSTLLYLGMGWMVMVAVVPLLRNMPPAGLAWLLAGGVLYSLGAIIYGLKWPGANARYFGFHEIFHLFVLGGSFCHFWMMYKYLLFLN
jgi:hemolysin III